MTPFEESSGILIGSCDVWFLLAVESPVVDETPSRLLFILASLASGIWFKLPLELPKDLEWKLILVKLASSIGVIYEKYYYI